MLFSNYEVVTKALRGLDIIDAWDVVSWLASLAKAILMNINDGAPRLYYFVWFQYFDRGLSVFQKILQNLNGLVA